MPKHKVLFLCTGNSCRSQMAEAIVNQQLGPRWQAFSAGTEPVGYVHPKALHVLAELGIAHQGHSKHVDAVREINFDLFDADCPPMPEGGQLPLVLVNGEVIVNGGKVAVPVIRSKVEEMIEKETPLTVTK